MAMAMAQTEDVQRVMPGRSHEAVCTFGDTITSRGALVKPMVCGTQ